MAKSDRHVELTRKSLLWLNSISTQRGIRGCEEVCIGHKYICDAAAICGLKVLWHLLLTKESKDSQNKYERKDHSFVFEIKVSRQDFFRKFKHGNRLSPSANFHFVVTTKDMISVEEVPTFWGLLQVSGCGLLMIKPPTLCPHPIEKLHEFAYTLLRNGHNRKFTYNMGTYVRKQKDAKQKKALNQQTIIKIRKRRIGNDKLAYDLIKEGRLKVDLDLGLVYSTHSNNPNKPLGSLTKKGYLRTAINFQGQLRNLMLHRVVWIAKHGVLPSKNMFVDHVDTIKTNNRASNLELVANEENMKRAVNNKLMKGGRKSIVRNDKGQYVTKEKEQMYFDGTMHLPYYLVDMQKTA